MTYFDKELPMPKKQILLTLALFLLLFGIFLYTNKRNKIINQQDQSLSALEESHKEIKELLKSSEEKLKSYKEDYDHEKVTVRDLKINLQELENKIQYLENDQIYSNPSNLQLYPIYASNLSAEYVLPHFYLYIDDSLILKEKIDLLIQTLGDYQFQDMPITLMDIKIENGKKIAYIDFTDSLTTDKTWAINYMPGSAGAIMTSDSLFETFLQRNLDLDDWIDGVFFSFNGQHIYMDSHDPGMFLEIEYRDD